MINKSFINNQLGIKFESYIDKKLRVWFKAKDVAQILGYQDTNQAIRKHVSENHKRTFLCCPVESTGQQNDTRAKYCIFLDEAGFYELVFRSRLPAAKMFREWVFTKVLPSIRKYGYYKMKDTKIKQRVIFDGKKYYKHQVFSDYAASKDGNILSLKTKKNLKMTKDRGGYLYFTIYNKKIENHIKYSNHRFVFEVFKGPIPKCFEVDHVNNFKFDNRIKNLQLLTPKQNKQKSLCRLIKSIEIETGKEKRYNSIQEASNKLDIHFSTISNICCKRKSYKTATSKKNEKKIHIQILRLKFQYLFKY